jgi:hypothetical protein
MVEDFPLRNMVFLCSSLHSTSLDATYTQLNAIAINVVIIHDWSVTFKSTLGYLSTTRANAFLTRKFCVSPQHLPPDALFLRDIDFNDHPSHSFITPDDKIAR